MRTSRPFWSRTRMALASMNPDFAIGQNRQDARRGSCRCMRILRTSRNAADCLFSPILKGLRIGCFFSSDVAFTFRCKRWTTALHFNLFVRSTIQIPANSQTQNLGSFDGPRQKPRLRLQKDLQRVPMQFHLRMVAVCIMLFVCFFCLRNSRFKPRFRI